MSRESPSSGGLVVRRKESETVNVANVMHAIADIHYLMEYALTAMMTLVPIAVDCMATVEWLQ